MNMRRYLTLLEREVYEVTAALSDDEYAALELNLPRPESSVFFASDEGWHTEDGREAIEYVMERDVAALIQWHEDALDALAEPDARTVGILADCAGAAVALAEMRAERRMGC